MTEWKTYRLGDIATMKYGKLPPKNNSGQYPIWSGYRNVGFTDTYNCSKGTIIVVARGVGGTGDVKIAKEDCFLTNLSIAVNIDTDVCLPQYFYYKFYLSNLRYLDSGSAQSQITIDDLKRLQISLPSLEEQRRIAGILGAIDDKIENNRRINTNLEHQAQALYKQWFVDNRSDDWEEIKLGDIIEISKKSITPSQSENIIFEHYSLPAFDDGIQPVFEKGEYIKSSKFIVEQNMFLFSKLNPRIKRIWFPNIQTENAICSTEFIPYKPKDVAMFGFCYSIVNSDSFYEYVLSLTNGSTGSHQRFHPIDTLDYELTIPNNGDIVKFEELVMPIYKTIASNRMESKNLATLRDTLLPKLMNGEIK